MEYNSLFRLIKFLLLFGLIVIGVQVLFMPYSRSNFIITKETPSKQNCVNRKVPNDTDVVVRSHREATLDPDLVKLLHDGNALPNYFLNSEQDKSRYRSTTLSFVHYPKGGGTTIKDCLTKIASFSGRSKPVLVFDENVVNIKEQILNRQLETTDIFMGTYGFSICENLHSKQCAYFTLLREPYERMVSHYYFCKDGGGSKAPCQKSIEDFASRVGSIFLHQLSLPHECVKTNGSQFSCKRISQLQFRNIFKGNYTKFEMMLNYLTGKLEDIFAVVGILEEFDVSLGLLQEAFGLPFYDECIMQHSNNKINKTTGRALERIAAKKMLMESKEVRKALAPDIILYEKVKEIFEKQKTVSHTKIWMSSKTN